MPTFDEVYDCLLQNGPGYAKGSKGGEYDIHAREINGVRTIDAQVRNGGLMWFKRNGHFAKNDLPESEVSNEYQKKQTTFYQRI